MPLVVSALLRENRGRVRLWLLVAAVVALLQCWGNAAGAADGGGDGRPLAGVTPPRLVASEPIERPASGEGGLDGERDAPGPGRDAVDVEMDLTIDADGSVANVVLVRPGFVAFDEAAIAGVRRFRFDPARRGGVAVPARVRYRHHFPPILEVATDPSSRSEKERSAAPVLDSPEADVALSMKDEGNGPPAVSVGVSDSARTSADPGELEYGATARVREAPRGTTRRTVEGAALVETPGTRGDALRVIELLPGVGRPSAADGQVIIRGSAPADSEVFFEGTQVLRLYHFGGLTSFVNGRLVDHIDLHPGNFSVKYGRKLGGIVDVGARDPRGDALHALADVNLIDASVLAEGPLGRSASIALGLRRSYIGNVISSLSSDGGILAAPVYDDYQLFVTWRPSDRDRVRFLGYGSRDSLGLDFDAPDQDPALSGASSAKTYFHRAQVSWEHRYSDRVRHEAQLAFGGLGFVANIGDALRQDITGPELFGRGELGWRIADGLSLAAGIDVTSQWLTAHYRGPVVGADEGDPAVSGPLATMPTVAIDTRALFFRPAGYAEATWHGPAGLTVIGGGRVDYFGDIAQTTFDPRLTARLAIGAATFLKGGVGRFSQAPSYGQAVPGIGNPNLRAARALHLDLGFEHGVGSAFSLGAEVFAKRLSELVVAAPGAPGGVENDGIGKIYGAEVSLKAQATRLSGFLSYTLSRSERRDHPDSAWRLFDYDQTHILTLASALHLPRHWEVGAAFRLVTGNPETPVTGSVYDADRDLYRPLYGSVNSARAPMFQRLDVRVEKQWHPGRMLLATYLDLQNAYNHKNIEATGYGFDYRQRVDVSGLPVFPSLGVRGEL